MPKKGHITPSQFKKVMTKGRKKGEDFGQTALTYADEVILGLLGVSMPMISAKSLDWGNEYEEFAIERYEEETLCSVQDVDKNIHHPKFNFVCGLPDGLVGEDGIVEIKCPINPVNHLNNIRSAKQYEQYKWQIQGYLWITGRKWCDFVSYFPDEDLDYSLQIAIKRIERDEDIIKQLEERILLFWEIVQEGYEEIIKKIK